MASWSDPWLHGLTHVFSQVRPSISDTDSQKCSTAAFSKGVIIGTHFIGKPRQYKTIILSQNVHCHSCRHITTYISYYKNWLITLLGVACTDTFTHGLVYTQ